MPNDFDFPKIFSEQFRFNMGPWLTEKSEHGLLALVELRKDIKKIEDKIDKQTLQYIHSDLYYAMFQMTKIYSFSLGSEYESGDEDLLFDKFDDGFEELKVKYGILDKTKRQIENDKLEAEKERRKMFFIKLAEYIKMEQYPGRSLMQELFENHLDYLQEKTIEARFLSKIEQDLYCFANGEISWDDFITGTNETIEYFLEPIKSILEGKNNEKK
jgi:hypothetical protein